MGKHIVSSKRWIPLLLVSYVGFQTVNAFSSLPIVSRGPKRVGYPNSYRPTRHSADNVSPLQRSQSVALAAGPGSSPLMNYFLETLIANGVPAVLTCAVIAFAASQFRRETDEFDDDDSKNAAGELYSDLYGGEDSGKNKMIPSFFNRNNKASADQQRNSGVPREEYITIRNLNEKLYSYEYSLTAATSSKAKAAARMRERNFDRAIQRGMDSTWTELPAHDKATLLEIEKIFLKKGSKLLQTMQSIQAKLTEGAIDEEFKKMGMESFELDPYPVNSTNVTVASNSSRIIAAKNDTVPKLKTSLPKKETKKLLQALIKAQTELSVLEMAFIQDVVANVGPDRANGVRTAFLGNIRARGTGSLLAQLQERPLSQALASDESPKNLFVARFPGDTTASQVQELREEVTAIVRNAQPGDEALVVLQTGGGTVTGYGLAAAQLQRFKKKGMKLTIAVEQVAASGGYMMCCVADRIVASPFAVLGSIGVITDIPNVYERLKQEGIEFQTVTAGKYKRTLTPTKKVTREDFMKTKEDVEDILTLFREFVASNRPALDIERVATGETWFGEDALERGLCDEIKTVDDVLMDYVDAGFNVLEVEYSPPPEPVDIGRLLPVGAEGRQKSGAVGGFVRWLVRTVASEVEAEFQESRLSSRRPINKKYMAMDDPLTKIEQKYMAMDD